MPVAKVCTPKCATVPKSAMVSMTTSRAPPASAGRAMGSDTRANAPQGEAPSARGGQERRARALQEGRAREQVDVGVEHQRQHGGGAAHRADLPGTSSRADPNR